MSGALASLLKDKRVALVERSSLVVILLHRALKHTGARIVAECPLAGDHSKFIRQKKPDLVLIECGLEDYSDAAKVVSQLAREEDAPCIVLLSSLPTRDEARLQRAGVDAVVWKPFTLKDLLPVVEQAYRDHCLRNT